MDASFAGVSILVCSDCDQHWLRVHFELEAFTASGRWYRGAISTEQVRRLRVEQARAMLEGLSRYFFGGLFWGANWDGIG